MQAAGHAHPPTEHYYPSTHDICLLYITFLHNIDYLLNTENKHIQYILMFSNTSRYMQSKYTLNWYGKRMRYKEVANYSPSSIKQPQAQI